MRLRKPVIEMPERRALLLAATALPAALLSRRLHAAESAESAEPVESDGRIVIRDALGEHAFDRPPERAVALQWDILENVVGCGVTPVGAADIKPWDEWVRTPALPRGVTDVGTRAEPNLARITSLHPDVILVGPTQADLIARLGAIAPTLVFDNSRADAPQGEAETAVAQFRELGRLFGRQAQVEARLARIDAELDALKKRLEAVFPTLPSVQVIRFSTLTTAFIYTPNSITDWTVRRLGMRQPLTAPPAAYGLVQRRLRDLKHLTDAHVLWVRPFSQERKLRESVLWQALPFVRRGLTGPAEPFWSHGGALSILETARSITEGLVRIASAQGRGGAS